MIDIVQRVALCAASLFVVLVATSRSSADPRDVRVRVTLDNGTRLEGIVRDGAMYERIVDGQFVRTSSAEVPGAGFRLWQMNDSAGFFFVKYADVRDFKEIGPADAASEAAADRDAMDKKLAGKDGKSKPPDTGALKKQAPPPTDEGAALLKKFPPQSGWTPDKKDQIQKRELVIGAFPSPEEKEWLDNYDKWRQAYDRWLAANPQKAPKPATPPTPPASGKSGSKSPSRSGAKGKNAPPDTDTGVKPAGGDASGGDDGASDAKLGVDGRPVKERPHKETKREEREKDKQEEEKTEDKPAPSNTGGGGND
jgi:hypothetical protein